MVYNEDSIFTKEIANFIRSSFYYLSEDIFGDERIFFENAGGSLRLKEVVKEDAKFASYPDCPERDHPAAKLLKSTLEEGINDIRLFLNAKRGSIIPGLTASKIMFEIIGTIAENVSGNNIVTTAIEHPSSFDACVMYANKTGKELRIAKANPKTGGVDIEEITALIDKHTVLLSVIWTSNLTGAVLDIKKIVKEARKVNPEIYIVVDAVQTAPHRVVDVTELQIDGLNIAPYKMFGNRGMAFGYVSDNVASLPHHRLAATKNKNWKIGSPTPAHFAGFSQVIDYITTIGSFFSNSKDRRSLIVKGMNKIYEQEQLLLKRLIYGTNNIKGLLNIEGVKLHFIDQDIKMKDLILGISFENMSCTEAVLKYAEHNIVVYDRINSNFYSKRILDSLNLEGIVRISPLHCHTFEEIDKFLLTTLMLAQQK